MLAQNLPKPKCIAKYKNKGKGKGKAVPSQA
jgi:hypothetical protein